MIYLIGFLGHVIVMLVYLGACHLKIMANQDSPSASLPIPRSPTVMLSVVY